ncbi:DUF742 domain-containing protein [Streptomyces sp. 4N509B]|uniref:DUF742 domain-containing protein n=1 Tax=Streptomyces sp. 4N509B TaxID=3457413 RepID=UPI003FD343B3
MSSDHDDYRSELELSALRALFSDAEDAVAQAVDPVFDEEAGLRQIRRNIAGATEPMPPPRLHAGGQPGPRPQTREPGTGAWMSGVAPHSAVPGVRGTWGNLARAATTSEDAQPLAPPDPVLQPLVRSYAMHEGRTRPQYQLAIEALVSTTADLSRLQGQLPEHQRICQLCYEVKSVAEVSALLSIPLGVARILVADLAEAGLVAIHQPAHGGEPGDQPDVTLLERVLSGLRRL